MENLRYDIIKVIDENKTVVATYQYDDRGKLLTSDADLTDIAEQNPFRYRGYYYDTESGLYYLNSRYYDPETGRFINADEAALLGVAPTGLTDKNLYAYCDNNPVMRADDGGAFWNMTAGAAIGAAINVVSQIAGNIIDGESIGKGVLMAAATGAPLVNSLSEADWDKS